MKIDRVAMSGGLTRILALRLRIKIRSLRAAPVSTVQMTVSVPDTRYGQREYADRQPEGSTACRTVTLWYAGADLGSDTAGFSDVLHTMA